MFSSLNDVLYIFSWRDYVIPAFMIYLSVVVLSDIRYRYTAKIADKLHLKREDTIFFIFVLSTIILFLFEIKFEFIEHLLAITSYYDARHEILRIDFLKTFFMIYGLLSIIMPILCSAIAAKLKMGFIKWFVYGLFLNVLAFIYLLHLRSERIGKMVASGLGS